MEHKDHYIFMKVTGGSTNYQSQAINYTFNSNRSAPGIYSYDLIAKCKKDNFETIIESGWFEVVE